MTVLMAHKESDLQMSVNKFTEASCLWGLASNLSKTGEVLLQPAPSSIRHLPSVSIRGTELKMVKEHKYLGSVIFSDGTLDKDVNARICKASQALCRLRTRVLNQHSIRQSTKLYKAITITTLLYGCETWNSVQKAPEAAGIAPHAQPEVNTPHPLAGSGPDH